MTQDRLDTILESEDEYVPVKVLSVACQINKSHGDPDLNNSSVSECLKGTTVRLPQPKQNKPRPDEERKQASTRPFGSRSTVGPMYDQRSVKLLNFGVNTITILILSYFLGGLAIAPLVNLPTCVGVEFSPARATPCLGSVIGLILGAFGTLGYTYYYFTRKL